MVGVDASFRFFQNLDVNYQIELQLPLEPARDARRLPDNWRTFFNNEMGFVPRQGVNNGELYVSGRFQPNWSCTKAGCERPIRIGRLRICAAGRRPGVATLMDRALVAKMTYLIAFSRFPISGPRSPVRRFSVNT